MPKAKQFVTDENGVRVAVMLDIKEYEELLEDLEDLQRFASMKKKKLQARSQFLWHKRSTRFAAIASELCRKHSAKRSK